MLLATGLLVAVSFVLGQAIIFLCGWRDPQWWAPALGYAALLTLFAQLIRVPRHPRDLIALAVVASVASLLLPFVRRSIKQTLPDVLVLGIGLTLLAAIPFLAAGYAGILGASVSNDMSQHLTAAAWFNDRSGVLPVAAIGGDLITTGYPIGPHALAAELSRALGIGEVRAFAAETLAVPVLTGFIAFGIVPAARRPAGWALAAVVGLGYLPAAYLAQGSFKEIQLAMLVLAIVVALNDLTAGDERIGWRRAIPVALLAGGAVYTYSYGALLWIGVIVIFLFFAEVFRRRELFSVVRRWALPAVGAGANQTSPCWFLSLVGGV